MTYSISAWNLINSMKQVDKWTQTIQANINGAARIGYKQFDIYYGGGPTNTLAQSSLVSNGKAIAETTYSIGNTQIDFSQGGLIPSDKWFHLAIDGEGFFMTTKTLSNPLPEDIQYTRDGEFYIDGDGLLRTKEGLYVLDGTSIPGDPDPATTSTPPWAGSIFNAWQKREGLLIKNDFSYTLTADTVVELAMDTQGIVSQGFAQADLDDLRIGYWNGTTWSEIAREIIPGTENTNNTKVRFRLLNDVSQNTNVVGEYYVFYDNAGAGAPAGPTQLIGVDDPDGVEDDFSGIFSPANDPAGVNSVEDWMNASGPNSWIAGPLSSPSPTWSGIPAGNIDYVKGSGYTIENPTTGVTSNLSAGNTPTNVYKRQVIDGLSNYPVGSADGVGAVRPGGWQFIDQNGNEIIMKVIDGTNTVNGGSVEYDFSITRADLNANEDDLDPTKTKYEKFDPNDIYKAPYIPGTLPDLTAAGSTSYDEVKNGWGPNPLSLTYSPYVSSTGVLPGDSNFDANDTVWAGSGGSSSGTTITENFGGGASSWETEYGSLTITSNQYMNTLPANDVGNDSKAYLDAGTFDNFEINTEFNLLGGSVSGDFAGLQIRKTNLDDDFYESGYTIAAELPNRIKIYKAVAGVPVEVASANLSAYTSANKQLRIVAEDNNIKVYVDGNLEIDYTDAASTYMSGYVGLRTSNITNTTTDYTVNEDFSTDPIEPVGTVLKNISGNLVHDPVNGNIVNNDGSGNSIIVSGGNASTRVNGARSSSAPDSPSLDISGSQITMEAWINPTAYGPHSIIVNKESSYEMALDASGRIQIAVETDAAGGWFWTSNVGAAVPLNQWSHVAGVYDATTNQMRIYVNGVLQHTQANTAGSTSITPTNNDLTIGRRDLAIDEPSYYFNGQIDEVRISDIARYSGGSYTIPTQDFTTDANTRALYHFDDALGSTTYLDSSGNNNHLTAEQMQYYNFSTNPIGTTIGAMGVNGAFGLTYDGVGAVQGGNTYAHITPGQVYDDFVLETRLESVTLGGSLNWAGIQFRKPDPNNAGTGYSVIARENGEVILFDNGATVGSVMLPAFTAGDNDKMVKIAAEGNNIKVYIDGNLYINYTDATPMLSGSISLRGISDTAQFKYDDIMIHSKTTNSALTSANPSPIDTSGVGVQSMSVYTPSTYDDFVLETDITFKETSGDPSDWGAVQFRKTNPDDEYYQSGYMVYIRETGQVELYEATRGVLAVGATGAFNVDDTKNIKIIANGANIKVYVDGTEYINFDDPTPVLTDGHISYRTNSARWAFDNLKIGDYPPASTNPGQAQWLIDEFELTTIEPLDNNYQYLLLRQAIEVGAEGVIRNNTPIDLTGFIDHDVTIVIRDSNGNIVHSIYKDSIDGYNNWSGTFDPYDFLTPGTNWIEIYASHEVASPPNVPPFTDSGNSYTIGPAQAQMAANGWFIGGTNPSAWQITNNTGSPYLPAGAPASYGNILYSTTNDDNYIYRGDSGWDDYSMTATVGVANTDDDMVMLWARVSAENVASGPLSGYAFMIQRPADQWGVGYGNHQIALARFDNGVPTILANEHTHPELMNWFNTNVVAAGTSWSQQHWNFKLEVEGPNISIYAGTRGTSATPAGPVPATPLVTVSDSTYPSGKFALKTISQVAWFDNIDFAPSPDRKTGFASYSDIMTGTGLASVSNPAPNEIQTIDAFQIIPRYYVDSMGNVIDRFGDGTNASNQNAFMRSDIAENLIDYDPNENAGLIVDNINDVPILNTRLVQTNPTPGGEARVYVDPTGANSGGSPDGIQYLGANEWNEFEIKLDFGLNQIGSNGQSYIYARYRDANNWVRARYDDAAKTIRLEKSFGGVVTQLGSTVPFNIPNSALLDDGGSLKLRVEGRRYTLYDGANNTLITQVDNVNPILYGGVALGSNVGAWFDNLQISQLLLSKVKALGNGVVAPNGPQDILDQMYLMVFRDQGGQYGLQYDKEMGATYFEETTKSGRPRALRPGVDGAGFLKTSNLETSNVDMNKQITHLAAHSDVYDTLTKQLVVYLDTIQSSLSLFR